MNRARGEDMTADGTVTAVSKNPTHTFSKQNQECITLLAGLGVEGDAHMGVTVKHRSRVAKDPKGPNLRQVHLLHDELLAGLNRAGFPVAAGNLGENITTHGIELLRLPLGTHLHLGDSAVVEVTGLRNPCPQIDRFMPGLMTAVIERDIYGNLIGKAGIMAVVVKGGIVCPGDHLRIEIPPEPHRRLQRV